MVSTGGQNGTAKQPNTRQTSLFARLAPGTLSYPKLVLSLVIGALGGWLFAYAQLPLPWMLGSMSALLVAALVSAPVGIPQFVRAPMVPLIGVLLGAGFSPQTLSHVSGWIVSIGGLLVFTIVCALAGGFYFRLIARTDPITAYYSAMPGGLIEMVIQGEERGGDARFIALVHAARIFLLVMSLPFLIEALAQVDLGGGVNFGPLAAHVPLIDWVWLVGVAIVGYGVGRLLRLPAAQLVGPMLASAAVHLAGWTSFVPANEVIIVAQVVIGTTIGCRFIGVAPVQIIRIFALSAGYALILIGVTLGFALILSQVTDFGFLPIMLAYSPGGLAEMSLIALSLQIEVAFVATHHVVRVLFVMLGATPALLLARKLFRRSSSPRR